MGFSRQEYWSGLPCPPPRDRHNPGIEPLSLVSPALAGRFFTTSATWETQNSGLESRKHISWNKPLSSQWTTWVPFSLWVACLFSDSAFSLEMHLCGQGAVVMKVGVNTDETSSHLWNISPPSPPCLRQPTPHIQAPSSLLNAYRINPGRAVLPTPVYPFKSHCFSPASTPLAEFRNH